MIILNLQIICVNVDKKQNSISKLFDVENKLAIHIFDIWMS